MRGLLIAFITLLATAGSLLAQTREIKFVLPPLPPNSAPAQGAPILAQRLSVSDLRVAVFPPGSVGNASAVLQGARSGTLPFAFQDIGQVFKFQESEAGRKLLESLDRVGLKGIDYWPIGMTQLFSNKPIREASDLRGLKLVAATPISRSVLQSLGANVLQVPGGEIFAALEKGVADGAESTPSFAQTSRLNTVQKFLNVTNQQYQGTVLVTNIQFWNGLSQGLQQRFMATAHQVTREVNNLAVDESARLAEALRREGIELNVPSASAFKAWRGAASNFWSANGGDSLVLRAAMEGGAEGGGDPCRLPECRCSDRTCSLDCCRRSR
jgi:TRAP-type C4-dicarboxylate transport system substrate-binding protein